MTSPSFRGTDDLLQARDNQPALNALKRDKTRKIGIKAKAKSCGWDHDDLLKILTD